MTFHQLSENFSLVKVYTYILLMTIGLQKLGMNLCYIVLIGQVLIFQHAYNIIDADLTSLTIPSASLLQLLQAHQMFDNCM